MLGLVYLLQQSSRCAYNGAEEAALGKVMQIEAESSHDLR